jgi:hypothetical protein
VRMDSTAGDAQAPVMASAVPLTVIPGR